MYAHSRHLALSVFCSNCSLMLFFWAVPASADASAVAAAVFFWGDSSVWNLQKPFLLLFYAVADAVPFAVAESVDAAVASTVASAVDCEIVEAVASTVASAAVVAVVETVAFSVFASPALAAPAAAAVASCGLQLPELWLCGNATHPSK